MTPIINDVNYSFDSYNEKQDTAFGGSFGIELNPSESEPFQNLFPNQSEKRFESHSGKIGRKLIRMNPNHVFNLRSEWFGFISIEPDWF